jgi:hypothetical protein
MSQHFSTEQPQADALLPLPPSEQEYNARICASLRQIADGIERGELVPLSCNQKAILRETEPVNNYRAYEATDKRIIKVKYQLSAPVPKK